MNGLLDPCFERRRPSRGNPPAIVEVLESRALLTTVTVDLVGFAFNPNSVTIHVGDTVEWDWQSDNHSTTSVAGGVEQWDSGVHNSGFTFDHTFTNVGTFVYYCTIHGKDNGDGTASGMAGKVVVLAPSPTPTPTPTPIAPLEASGVSFRAKAGKNFHKTLAHFSERGTQPSNFTILVDWGDQSGLTRVSPHRVGKKGKFTAIGSHRYVSPGVYQVMVMIDDSSGQEAHAMTTVNVKGKRSAKR